MADILTNVGGTLTGAMGEDEYGALPGLEGPNRGAYQIAGGQQYQDEMGAISGGLAGAPDLQGATAKVQGDQSALQAYLQSVAMGHGETAADRMFQNATAQNARQAQSAAVSAGGMNPALAMRQIQGAQSAGMGDIAGKSAAQKLQQQEHFAGMAQQGNAQMFQQQFQQAQTDFQNKMMRSREQADIAGRIFQASRDQTSYNVAYDQNRQAFAQLQRLQAQQQAADLKRSQGNAIKGIARGGLTALGGVVGGVAGAFAGGGGAVPGALGGMAAGGALGNAVLADEQAKMDPALLAAMSKQPAQYSGPTSREGMAQMGEDQGYLMPNEGRANWRR